MDIAATIKDRIRATGFSRWRHRVVPSKRRFSRVVSGRALSPRLRLGLALSCGAAKGLAHIGVIQVLEEHGIEVDMIAGSSMGAYIAAVWGRGLNGRQMEALALEIRDRWGVWRLVDPVFPPRQGFIRGKAMVRRLKRTLGAMSFRDLPRPIRVVATNLETLEKAVFQRGEVARAVHASCAIPGVCVPVKIKGESYIDGGIADPIPVGSLIEAGMDRIIAVNVIPPTRVLRRALERDRELSKIQPRPRGLGCFLNRHLNYFARGNLLDILMQAIQGGQIRLAEAACGRADLVLRPISIDSQWHEFDQPTRFIQLGRRVAEAHLDEIQDLMKGEANEAKNRRNAWAMLF